MQTSTKKAKVNTVSTLFKTKTPRDNKYIEWIRSLSCCICGYPAPSDPHHSESGGKGIKGSDYSCLPFCHKHHALLHNNGKDSFCKDNTIDLKEMVLYFNKRYMEKNRA